MRLIRLLVLIVVITLVLAFGAWKSSQAPLEVQCGTVSGGNTAVARGVGWAQRLGGWVHQVASNPDQYRDPQNIKETIDGVFRGVLWYWLRTAYLSSRGEKIDPQILQLEQDAAKEASAADDDCTPCPDAQSQDNTPDPRAQFTSLSRGGNGSWTSEQAGIAKTAIAVGKDMHIPQRGWVVIIAAGWQESGMRNLTYGDRDSIGWLQQRAGWGTVKQRMDPAYQARKFYQTLKRVHGWQSLPVTVAAQRVQISAYPSAYAKWENRARQMVATFSDQPPTKTPPAPQREAQCVTPQQEAAGTRMVTVAGSRRIKEPTSGVTYNIPIPKGARGVAINFALDQVEQGDWYRWAAHGPNFWDCSGLAAGAWAKAGVHMTPQTEAMRRTVPLVSTAQPGDLFYHYGHVAIYAGKVDGKSLIIEAPRTGSRLRLRPNWMKVTAILDPMKVGRST